MVANPCDSAQASTDYLEIRDSWIILSQKNVKPWEYCAMNSVGRRVEMRCFKVVQGVTGFIIMVLGEDGTGSLIPEPEKSMS